MDSVLTDVKKSLGIAEDETHFDHDIVLDINASLLSVNQIGIGPGKGFMIKDKTNTWQELLGTREDLEAVKTLVYMKVKLMFDPPANSFLLESINKTIDELTWRLSIQAPTPPIVQ